eukprot:SAG22_NODE_3496_length_1681_cov_5.011378_2_plen_147_part_00
MPRKKDPKKKKGIECHPYSVVDLPAGTSLWLKWLDDPRWRACDVAAKQPAEKRTKATLWRGWYILDFEEEKHRTAEAFDVLTLARDSRVRFRELETSEPAADSAGHAADGDANELQVGKILGKRVAGGGTITFKVRWEGYGADSDT